MHGPSRKYFYNNLPKTWGRRICIDRYHHNLFWGSKKTLNRLLSITIDTCQYLPDKFSKLFVLLRRNFNELLKSSLHSRRQSTYKSCCTIIKSHTIYAFIYMIAWLLANSHCCSVSKDFRVAETARLRHNTRPVVSCNAQLACMTGSVAARKHTNTDPVITMRAAALRKPLFSSTW